MLFDKFTYRSLQLANRTVMAPMTRSRATPQHTPDALMATYYAQRATAGLIITEGTSPSPNGLGYAPEALYELSNVHGATEAAQQYVHEESYIERFNEWEAMAAGDENQHAAASYGRLCIAKKVTDIYSLAGLERGSEENKRRLLDHLLNTGWERHKGSLRVRDKLNGNETRLQDPFVKYL